MGCCDAINSARESAVQLGATLSLIATVVGVALAYVSKPEIMRALENFGAGTNSVEQIGTFADLFFVVVLAVNVLAMIPILFANPPARKKFFARGGGGCCSCCAGCVQCIIAHVVTNFIEVVVFVSLIACLGVSYVFLFGSVLVLLFDNICVTSPEARQLAQNFFTALNSTDIGEYVGGVNVAGFCDDQSTKEVVDWAAYWLVGGVVLTVVAQTLTFQAAAKAKEAIQHELKKGDDAFKDEATERMELDESVQS